MFLREYVPQSLRDAWSAEFEQLRQGSMTVSKYAVRFSDLAQHAPALVAIVRERVRRFIKGLHPSIRLNMAQELEMEISYQQVMSIARRLEGMLAWEREERESKRSRESGTYSGTRVPTAVRHGRGYVSSPVHSALPAASAIPTPSRPKSLIMHHQYLVHLLYGVLLAGYDIYLAYVRDVIIDTPIIESVLVVRDFLDVFPADLLGMPPDKDNDFGNDLLPGTQPISIPPYRMAPPELKEQL
ncbi:uncharacterized protein [Nicotiana tomentosiformis]|uniref:uncharacterized protein n=1 Tax=Nicotiana tomentosiformis TaxID=4098 RepID=UPI00388C7413